MIKVASLIEERKGERVYQFICDHDSPLGEVYDVICKMKFEVYQRIKEFEASQESKEDCKEGCQ